MENELKRLYEALDFDFSKLSRKDFDELYATLCQELMDMDKIIRMRSRYE